MSSESRKSHMAFGFFSGISVLFFLSACSFRSDDRALLKEAHDIFYEGKQHPGPAKYHTDLLGASACQNAARAMRGKNMTPEEGRQVIRNYITTAKQGAEWNYIPPAVKIPAAPEKVRIDGLIEEKEWGNAFLLRGQYAIGKQNPDTRDNPSWRLMWDKQYLYISGEFKNTGYRQVGKNIYQADCFEAFIRIDRRIGLYWEMIVNFENRILCDYRNLNYWGSFSEHRMPRDLFPGLQYRGCVRNGTMFVEIALPWRLIPGFFNTRSDDSPKQGEEVLFSLVRIMSCADSDHLDYYSAVPLLYGGHNLYGQITGILD